jgi:hypothetical protein
VEEGEEGEVDIGSSLISDREPSVLTEPRARPLHHPPVPAESLLALNALPGYPALDAASPEATACTWGGRSPCRRDASSGRFLGRPLGRLIGLIESSSSSNSIVSCLLAPLNRTESGMPPQSTTTWRFVRAPSGHCLCPSDSARSRSPPCWPGCSRYPDSPSTSRSCQLLPADPAGPDGAAATRAPPASLVASSSP